MTISTGSTFFVLLVLAGIDAELVITASEGDSTVLRCSTLAGTSVSWYYRRAPTDKDSYIVITGSVVLSYRDRFQLTVETFGDYAAYTLAIGKLSVSDSGNYTCIDRSGFGERSRLHLIVRSKPEMLTSLTSSPTVETVQTGYEISALVLAVCVTVPVTTFVVIAIVALVIVLKKKKKEKKQETGHQKTPLINKKDAPAESNSICGITVLDDKLYVISSKALVFSRLDDVESPKDKPHPRNKIDLSEIVKLKKIHITPHPHTDMTSCQEKQILYISDYRKNRVAVIPVRNGSPPQIGKIEYWTVKRPAGLSVDPKTHNLLVSCVDASQLIQFNVNDLSCFRKQPSIIMRVILPQLYWPMHAIQVGRDGDFVQFVVCDGGDNVRLVQKDVKEKKEKPPHAYRIETSQANNNWAWPCNMTVDDQGGIYVADHYGDRVMLIKHKLDHTASCAILGNIKLHRPRRICWHRNKLYIGDAGDAGYSEVISVNAVISIDSTESDENGNPPNTSDSPHSIPDTASYVEPTVIEPDNIQLHCPRKVKSATHGNKLYNENAVDPKVTSVDAVAETDTNSNPSNSP